MEKKTDSDETKNVVPIKKIPQYADEELQFQFIENFKKSLNSITHYEYAVKRQYIGKKGKYLQKMIPDLQVISNNQSPDNYILEYRNNYRTIIMEIKDKVCIQALQVIEITLPGVDGLKKIENLEF